MLSESRCRELFEAVMRASDADETEVHISSIRQALTRFANNTIHQNVEDQSVSLSVRTVYGGRTARATTNKLDADSIARCVRECVALARSSPVEADLQPMPG